jgi:putative endonuclease
MYYAYILRCSDDTLYVGCTNDLKKRAYQHNHAKSGAHYTKIRRPVVLVHSERFRTLARARAREAELKRLSRTEKLTVISIGHPKKYRRLIKYLRPAKTDKKLKK